MFGASCPSVMHIASKYNLVTFVSSVGLDFFHGIGKPISASIAGMLHLDGQSTDVTNS